MVSFVDMERIYKNKNVYKIVIREDSLLRIFIRTYQNEKIEDFHEELVTSAGQLFARSIAVPCNNLVFNYEEKTGVYKIPCNLIFFQISLFFKS